MKPRYALASGAIAAVVATSMFAQESLDVVEVLRQARRFSYQAREGRFDVVPAAVALLEDATAKSPQSAALWSALSNAYFLQATAAGQAGQDATQAFGAIARASVAADRALAIEPDNPDALSNHGAALILRSLLEGKPELAPQGSPRSIARSSWRRRRMAPDWRARSSPSTCRRRCAKRIRSRTTSAPCIASRWARGQAVCSTYRSATCSSMRRSTRIVVNTSVQRPASRKPSTWPAAGSRLSIVGRCRRPRLPP